MITSRKSTARYLPAIALGLLATATAHAAAINVTPTVSAVGDAFKYSYAISNTTPDDSFLIDIPVFANPSTVFDLTAPTGFLAAFDSGLGLVSFLENTATFGREPISGFSFESFLPPGGVDFQATLLDPNGNLLTISGPTTSAVPEPGFMPVFALLAPLSLLVFRRRGGVSQLTLLEVRMKKLLKRNISARAALSAAGAFFLLSTGLFSNRLTASSHSDAPLIKQDPQANLTDVYTFVGLKYNDPSNTKVLNIVVNVHPFSEPGDGVLYERFADDALFSIHVADPNTGALLTTYNFSYSPISSAAGTYKNLDTILSYGRGTTIGSIEHTNDSAQNYTQTYSVTKVVGGTSTLLANNLLIPPPNVGIKTTPLYNDANGISVSGATTAAGLDTYTKETIHMLDTGEVVWSGPRDDSFFADAAGIFDLLEARILGPDGHGQTGNGVDGFKGFNVLTFAIQIPLSSLPSITYQDAFTGTSHGVGVYASVSRPRITLRSAGADPLSAGPWTQVNRLANPLFNEVLVALRDKDNYNRDVPTSDVAKYKTYATTPELALLINAVFGLSFATTGRADLAAVYIPDVIRVDTTTGPVPLIGAGGNRLSGLGGDTTNGKWSGWPNGRRFGDDVADIALTAIASGPTFKSIFLLGDNISANDTPYNQVFPYAATPHAGPTNRKDP